MEKGKENTKRREYSYKDFFVELKEREWESYETLLQVGEWVVLSDFFPKSRFHFLVLHKTLPADNLLQVSPHHLDLFLRFLLGSHCAALSSPRQTHRGLGRWDRDG